MKKVRIIGTGCPKCNQRHQNTQQAVAELTVDAIGKSPTLFGYMAVTRLR